MLLKNLFAALIPQILMVICALYFVFHAIHHGQSVELILASFGLALFIAISIITAVKVVRYPNDPTYLK